MNCCDIQYFLMEVKICHRNSSGVILMTWVNVVTVVNAQLLLAAGIQFHKMHIFTIIRASLKNEDSMTPMVAVNITCYYKFQPYTDYKIM